MAWALAPAESLYRALWQRARRRAARQPGSHALRAPVVVVGNLVVGGAGKTPTVLALAQGLRDAGRRPAILSRGYGRQTTQPRAVAPGDDARQVGDEPLLLARRTGVPVWVGAARLPLAQALCAAHPDVDVLISDDGLQHWALPRVAELVVFDERGAGNGRLLPAGPLREPLTGAPPLAAGTARWVVYTAGVASTPLPGWLAQRQAAVALPLADWWQGGTDGALPLARLQRPGLWAAAGLAAPEKFFSLLRQAGLGFQALPLPDHHPYRQLPWPPEAADVLVTEKDAVKLHPAAVGRTRVWVVPLDLALPAGLWSALHQRLAAHDAHPASSP